MPKGFEMCQEQGGKIITKKIGKDKYTHICIMDGKTYMGEIKMRKQMKKMMK